ncbi:MAG TPA: FUSC family protein [Vulgatibacter sp.]|nr:FUSC family protein [Vulgatibacter sp.]
MGWKRRVGAPLRSSVRVQRKRPAIYRGLQAGVAAGAPLALAAILSDARFVWVGFAGLFTLVGDRGGSYPARARGMLGVGLACALAASVASLAGDVAWVAIASMAAWGFASGMGWVWGDRWGVVGRLSAIVFAASLFTPAPDLVGALWRGGLFLLGAVWSFALALASWPFRPYRPARTAVEAAWKELASHAAGLGRLAATRAGDRAFVEHLRHHDAAVRAALEEARAIVLSIRKGASGETRRGERLVVLLEGAYRSSAILDGTADQLEWIVREPEGKAILEETARVLGACATRALAIGAAARDPDCADDWLPVERDPRLRLDLEPLRAAVAGRPAARPLVALLERLASYLEAAAATAAHRPSEIRPIPFEAKELGRASLAEPLRDHLTFRSIYFRHALRIAAIAGIATALAILTGLEKGQWLVLAAISTLTPYYGATFERGLQRVAGTIGGGVIAAVAAALATKTVGMPLVVFAFSAIGVALLPLNWGLHYAFLTPAYLVLAEPGATDWHLVGIRIENAVVGSVVALIATWILWPSPEVRGIPHWMVEALRADDEHICDALDGASAARLRRGRRRAGIAAASAEASFQRLLTEGHASEAQLEAIQTIVTYARRLGATITAIAEARALRIPIPSLSAAGPIVHRVLSDLADALERSRPPRPFPADATWPTSGDPFSSSLLRRLERQLAVLHGAVSRLEESPA